ncbi:unnamed protein product [Ectocarpus sp. 6 AP-2014]
MCCVEVMDPIKFKLGWRQQEEGHWLTTESARIASNPDQRTWLGEHLCITRLNRPRGSAAAKFQTCTPANLQTCKPEIGEFLRSLSREREQQQSQGDSPHNVFNAVALLGSLKGAGGLKSTSPQDALVMGSIMRSTNGVPGCQGGC